MKNVLVKKVAAAATAGAILISANAAFAAPVGSMNATLEKAAPGRTTEVYYRRWGPGPWVGAAIVGGVIAGAAIANANRPYYYYDPYGPAPAGYAADPGLILRCAATAAGILQRAAAPAGTAPGLSAALLGRRRRERAIRLLDALLISNHRCLTKLSRRASCPPFALFYHGRSAATAKASGMVMSASSVSKVRMRAKSGASPPSWRAST